MSQKQVQADVVEDGGKADHAEEQRSRTDALINNLYQVSSSEHVTPSVGNSYSVPRDPHLRLRRTLTPSLNVGIPKYSEAQFILSRRETSGMRLSLNFSACFGASANEVAKRRHFAMDAYAWGASERDATVRVVTVHGISPGVSRTRFHSLGERFASSARVRFVALDWHSIDRSLDDEENDEFLTCLPKHMMDTSLSCANVREEIIQLYGSMESQERCRKFLCDVSSCNCPRNYDDGGRILRSVIEEGLGWGRSSTPFVLGLKSWSGGIGVRMLASLHHSSFANNIQGAIFMHPGCVNMQDIVDVMSSGMIPTALMCWAKDDPLMPYGLSKIYLGAANSSRYDTRVKLISYDKGGHHNFDGSDDLPNFDDEAKNWIDELS